MIEKKEERKRERERERDKHRVIEKEHETATNLSLGLVWRKSFLLLIIHLSLSLRLASVMVWVVVYFVEEGYGGLWFSFSPRGVVGSASVCVFDCLTFSQILGVVGWWPLPTCLSLDVFRRAMPMGSQSSLFCLTVEIIKHTRKAPATYIYIHNLENQH